MIVAPFLGEFGWEVSLWAPWLRWMRIHHYPNREFMVVCRPGHEYLYEDLSDKMIPVVMPKSITKIDCQIVWVNGVRMNKTAYIQAASDAMGRKVRKGEVITPLDMQVQWSGNEPPHLGQRGEYLSYKTLFPQELGWMGIHARRSERQPERNWSIEKWNYLLPELGARHIVAVGTRKDAYGLPEAEDLRGLSLRDVCLAFSKCQVVVGPSSGPLALAMLCGIPVVWWSPNVKDKLRFEKFWNPFQVETVRVASSWNPDTDEVEAACQKFL